MARMMLFEDLPVYFEYEPGATEKRLEEICKKLWLVFEDRVFNEDGIDLGSYFPNNYGYHAHIENKGDYKVCGYYARYGNMRKERELASAIQALGQDDSVYQTLQFHLEFMDDRFPLLTGSIEFEVFDTGPVTACMNKENHRIKPLRERLMEAYEGRFEIKGWNQAREREYFRFDVPLVELADTVVEAIKL